ncbi:MAG: uroporphyrinogen decarboxylase family protein [Candidatus Bipolaricaulia bacterium]
MPTITSRERVKKTLEFEDTDRNPRDLWWVDAVELYQKKELNEVLEKFPPDIIQPQIKPHKTPIQRNSVYTPQFTYNSGFELSTKGKYIDEWGCVKSVAEDGVNGEVKEPLLKDITNLEKVKPPWEYLKSVNISAVNERYKQTNKFVLSPVCARPFERMQFLRGTENLYKDLIKKTDEVLNLLDIVHKYNLEHIKKWLETDVDGIFLMDDWGGQSNLLISPRLWREIFKPIYQEYIELIHNADKYVFFHSDGCIEKLYEDFAKLGVDAINSQLFVMDIKEIAQNYGGMITFWGEIDRQNILPYGTTLEVERAVFKVRKEFKKYSGGLIAQCEWGKNNPKENIETVFNSWQTPFEELEKKMQKLRLDRGNLEG